MTQTVELVGMVGVTGVTPQLTARDGLDAAVTCRVQLVNEVRNEWIAVQASIHNASQKTLRIERIHWRGRLVFPGTLGPRYFHTENFRRDFFDTNTLRGEHYWKPLPPEMVEHGWSEDQVFPGLFVGSRDQPGGLFCAAASQDRFHVIYRISQQALEWVEHPTGLDWIELPPGGELRGETVFLALTKTNDPQQATEAYYALLRTAGLFDRRRLNPLARQRIWCSWNYDFFGRVTEADCVRQLPVLQQHFPTVGFVQLDDGYQRIYPNGHQAQIDFLYQTDTPFDRTKFPSAPRDFAAQIKAAGLRPAIWLGLWAVESSPMLQEHPDWVLRLADGRRLSVGPEPTSAGPVPRRQCVLDPSVPGVREYLDFVCRTVFGDWGFEGVKLDFSTFAFECKRARFSQPGRTALEWRRWLVETFRKYLPADGFFGWCVVAGTGNPLQVTGGADYFRCAEDIGEGSWPVVKNIAAWCANTGVLLQERPLLPNIDSIGWSRHWTETEWETWLNLCLITGMALEVSGDLTRLDEPKLRRLNRTLELSDPARRVRCLDLPTDKIEAPPRFWLAEGARDKLLAVFNWSDDTAQLDRTAFTEPLTLPAHASVLRHIE